MLHLQIKKNISVKIAVNTRLLLPKKLEGIGWVSYQILKRITTNHPEHEFYFLFDRQYSEEFIFSNNVKPVIVHPQSRHPFLWYLYFEWGIPMALKRIKPDLFLSPDGWTSLRANVKKLTIFHDQNFEYFPDFMPKLTLKYVKHYVPRYAHASDRIVAVSEFTKNDIIKLYNIDPEKIDVVYNASNSNYKPLNDTEKASVKKKYTDSNDYFVYVGSLHKRKNIANLLLAFDTFKNTDNQNIKLLIVGSKMWRKGYFEETYNNMKHKDDVIFTGYLDAEELSKVVASSIALAYVSFFEGFGIPIIEGFEAETAVITSNTTSMPEVAGDAALLVDPYSVEQIADALTKLSADTTFRQSLIEKGRIRRQAFNWDKSAEEYWNIITKMI